MGALTDPAERLGADPVTDLAELRGLRGSMFATYGVTLPLQPAERAAGLTDEDVTAQLAAAQEAIRHGAFGPLYMGHGYVMVAGRDAGDHPHRFAHRPPA